MMLLELKDVYFSYDSRYQTVDVLKGVNAQFERGRLYGIVGKSGSGKSTVLSLMAGLSLPASGKVILDGQCTADMDLEAYRREKVSVIYQSFRLLPLLTTEENVMYPMELRGASRRDAQVRAREYLAEVDLPKNAWRRFPQTLSGGEQQRVAIARALACDTHLLLADEPTGNLDMENSRRIIDLLRSLAVKRDFCVIIVTHDVDVIGEMDAVYRMKDGLLIPE